MTRNQKILATLMFAAAGAINATARAAETAADESAFFECSREIEPGNVAPCRTPEADAAWARFHDRAKAEVSAMDKAVAADARKAKDALTGATRKTTDASIRDASQK